MTKKLILLDDHTMVLQGLSTWFATHSDFTVLGTAETVESSLALIDRVKDEDVIAVTDLSFSNSQKSGYDILEHIQEAAPKVIPVIYSSFCDGGYITQAFDRGAKAFVSKNASESLLLEAIQTVCKGKTFVQGDLVEKMLFVHEMYRVLTKKELQLLDLLAKGHSKDQICREMNITLRTVENYLSRMYDKTYTNNIIELLECMGRRFK